MSPDKTSRTRNENSHLNRIFQIPNLSMKIDDSETGPSLNFEFNSLDTERSVITRWLTF